MKGVLRVLKVDIARAYYDSIAPDELLKIKISQYTQDPSAMVYGSRVINKEVTEYLWATEEAMPTFKELEKLEKQGYKIEF
jgi:hypothetical protein